ncbi:hypothetical protein [Turneriella parva]|jgi:uncharacterized membrane protein|uniref:Uncharacterized protein n=1 Tax=Turneriella parva (strain ATCC BAA-1111 / DSM 21527 / NCTC 11395 / H) TaxID=869212 RepID=I4BBH4_TURPD|nr:hypothetical protein [Turneriella parva]AFM14631.1 hypothetical protein Turpa_3997 [Turneriella parva DSM 21527]
MVHALLIALYYLLSEALIYFLAGQYIYLTASPLVVITHFASILLLFVVAERHAMRRSRVFLITLGAVALIGSLVEYAVARSRYIEKFDADYFQLPANYDGILTLAAFALLARLLVAAILLFTLRHLPSGHLEHRRH